MDRATDRIAPPYPSTSQNSQRWHEWESLNAAHQMGRRKDEHQTHGILHYVVRGLPLILKDEEIDDGQGEVEPY